MEDQIRVAKPSDIDTERAILGLAILDSTSTLVNKLIEKVRLEDFYDPKNQKIFDAIFNLSMSNEPVDYITIENELNKTVGIDSIGGMDYLLGLVDPSYYSTNFDSYVEIIKEKTVLRRLIELSDETLRRSYSQKDLSSDIIAQASDALFNMYDHSGNEGLVRIDRTVEDTYNYMGEMAANGDKLTGITSGFEAIDDQLSGFQNSDLILIAARPSVGKTALGINMAVNAAKKDKKSVAIFSLEMSKRQLNQRIISQLTSVDLQNIISGNLSDSDWTVLVTRIQDIKNLDIYIDDTASISLAELRAKAKRQKIQYGLDLIVIDYLQLMTVESKRNENRQQEISTISRGLKALAKELNVPVIALSQLSRKSEERADKRPMMSDLRESGAIEQDADVIMMLYRDDYYNEDSEEQNTIEVNIAKHRNGPTGTVKLRFEKEYTRFADFGKG